MAEEIKCPHCGKPVPPGTPGGLCPECMVKVGIGSDAGTVASGSKRPTPAPPSPEAIARHFPQLEIIELLGSGGMGAVYKARQREIDRLVALKILPSEAAGDPGFAERFTREARALARLNHPNIVGLYHFGHVNGLHYFIMEYVDGLNLRQLEQAGRLSPREALEIIPQICEALQFAHDEGIVHRDIKPENVLLDKKGRVKIADFGLARILGHEPEDFRLTRAREVMGTPHYMAPEQIEKPQSVDHRADIYSLGVVFYEMLTGELPLGRFAPPSQKVQIDVRLDDVVLRALEKEPGRRYQHANEVKTAMDTIRTEPPDSTVGAVPPLPGSGSRQASSRRQAVLVAAAAVLLLMAVVLVLAWRRSSAGRAEAQAAALAAMIRQSNATVSQEPKPGATSGWFYVSGEVKTPCRRPYDSRMTVLRVITSAGGFTPFADKESVELTRADGQSQIVNCLKALDDASLAPDIRPGDTIHVPRRAEYGADLTSASPGTNAGVADAAEREVLARLLARRYGLPQPSPLSPTTPAPAANLQPTEAPSEAFARRYGLRPSLSPPNAVASPDLAISGRYGLPPSAPPPAPSGPFPTSPAPTAPTPLNYQWRTDTNNTSGVMTPDSHGNVTDVIPAPPSPTESPTLPVSPVAPTGVIPALATPDSPANVSFTVAANGTSPIAYQWYKTPNDSTNPPAPAPDGLILTRLAPLYVTLALEGVTTNAASSPRYIISIEDAGAPSPKQRAKRQYYCLIGSQTGSTQPFILRDVQGPADNPKVVLELIATKESVSVDKDHPFQRVRGYAADLKYGPENKTWANRRVGSVLLFARDAYEIVEVTSTVVTLRQKSNDNKWMVKYDGQVAE